jgi:predicted nucleic-acid-binding protein
MLLEKEKNIYIPEVVFPEVEYVLTDQYGISREKLITIFQFLSSQKNIKLSQYLKKAITIFEKTHLDMADCIIASYALKGALASFDRELLEVQGINCVWKK